MSGAAATAPIPGQWIYTLGYQHLEAETSLNAALKITSHGRIHMAVLFAQQVFLFEFKVVELVPEGRMLVLTTGRQNWGFRQRWGARSVSWERA